MIAANELPPSLSERKVCDVLSLCRNTYRSLRRKLSFIGPYLPPDRCRKNSYQPRALKPAERKEVLDVFGRDEYQNQPPVQIYYHLLQLGVYLCSISTMHRLLRLNNANGERRNQRAPQSHNTPHLRATKPNEVWTWDITKLPTRKRGEYLSLYVVMDLYSRYIVAWMLSRKENSALSTQLIDEAAERYQIEPNALTLHQDRGVPMTAHCYLDLLSELAITASHSRPRVSNDNPMSESQFKTLKYQPDYPRRFESYEHALQWCEDYVAWYNHEHHHSNLAGFTPEQVFTGEYKTIAKVRQTALDNAFRAHPERFANGVPRTSMPPEEVFINPVLETDENTTLNQGVNFPTLPRAIEKQFN
ncbi:TPA: IS3 family transposase [Proteus mirabilis]|nr:IS3 family transposase [Proteus mirabilis]